MPTFSIDIRLLQTHVGRVLEAEHTTQKKSQSDDQFFKESVCYTTWLTKSPGGSLTMLALELIFSIRDCMG